MHSFSLALAALLLAAPVYAQSSAAARWLVQQEEREACHQGGGRLGAAGIVERDLTVDGRADLILHHAGMDCAGRGLPMYCGAQACSLKIFVREGDLLVQKLDTLAVSLDVGAGNPPPVRLTAHGGQPTVLRWTGRDFR